MPIPSTDADTMFAEFLQELPPEIEAMARDFKAFCRARKIKTVAQLLRAVMLFAGLDLSEREVAANLVLTDPTLDSLTDEAVRQRLQACQPWLQALLPKLLQREPLPELASGLRLLVIDATNVVAPGQKKTSYRLHVAMDVVRLQLVWVQITDGRTGETLKHFEFAPGDVVMVDRGYARRQDVSHAVAGGAQVIVRHHPHHFPVSDATGQRLDVAAALATAEPGSLTSLEVTFQTPDAETVRAWVHAYRLCGEAAAAARRRCWREAQKGRYTPKASTVFLAEFVLVLTTIPPTRLSPQMVLSLYRCRWQVELLIKKWKSLLDLDQLRARAGSPLAAVWLHGKLLYAVVIDGRLRRRCGDHWARLDQQRSRTWWRLWNMMQHQLNPLITAVACWDTTKWPAALHALTERPRRRRLQSLPTDVVVWLHTPATPSLTNVSGGSQLHDYFQLVA